MSKHTAGPWLAVEIGQGGPADNPMPIYVIQSKNGYATIAEYVDANNAPVLAAAPELLEALQDLIGWIPNEATLAQMGFHTDAPVKAHRKARAAIDKALGKAA